MTLSTNTAVIDGGRRDERGPGGPCAVERRQRPGKHEADRVPEQRSPPRSGRKTAAGGCVAMTRVAAHRRARRKAVHRCEEMVCEWIIRRLNVGRSGPIAL